MTYVGLLLYTLLDRDNTSRSAVFSLRCLCLYTELLRETPDSKASIADAKSLADEHYLEHIGVERLVLRFKRTLFHPEPLGFPFLCLCLSCLWLLASSPSVQLLCIQHGLFERINWAVGVRDDTEPEAAVRLKLWTGAQDILEYALHPFTRTYLALD